MLACFGCLEWLFCPLSARSRRLYMPPKMSSPYSLRIERFLQDSSGSSALPPNSYPLRYPHPHTNHQMHSPTPSRSTGNGEAGVRRVQEKPRLLLMGQRRCVSIQFFTLFIFPLSLFFSFFFFYILFSLFLISVDQLGLISGSGVGNHL